MSTLDIVLCLSNIAMLVFMGVVAKTMLKKGVALKEVIMDLCAVFTFTMGEDHKATVASVVSVVLGMIVFNYFWPVPVYTGMWIVFWVVGWILQAYVRLSTGTPFGNMGLWGIKAIASFMK